MDKYVICLEFCSTHAASDLLAHLAEQPGEMTVATSVLRFGLWMANMTFSLACYRLDNKVSFGRHFVIDTLGKVQRWRRYVPFVGRM